MNKTFNVALIGCGTISTNHLNALTKLENVRVVALCDLKPEKAEAKLAQFGIDAKIYTDYDLLLEKEDLDAVHIATPHYLHCEMTLKALKKNINDFLEKPTCISNEELDMLIAAEKESSASVCVCFQNRFNPSTALVEKLIEEDGGAKSAFGTVFWYRSEKYYTESGWRGQPETEGGGVMINQAIHTLDLLTRFVGTPESVIATKANHHLMGIINVEDSCEGIIKFTDGKRANFYVTTSFEGKDCTTLTVVTNKKRLVMIMNSKVYVNGEPVAIPESATAYVGKEVYGNGHVYLIAKFYEALMSGDEMPVTLENSQYALRILLAAYKSNDNEILI